MAMTIAKAKDVVAKVVSLPSGNRNVLFVGRPGIGKSEAIEQVARALGMLLLIKHPVVEDPTDYKGLPSAVTVKGKVKADFTPFGDLEAMIETKDPMLVLFDDIGQSVPAVQAALMQLVLARRINGHKISDQVRFLACTNRREDKAAVTGLISPLLDRFVTVLHIDYDHDEWVNWAMDVNLALEVIMFVRMRPQILKEWTPSKDMTKSPTPRSMAGLATLIEAGVTEPEAYEGAIGKPVAVEFLAFLRLWRETVDPDEIFMNPDTAKIPATLDALYATLGSLAQRVTKDNLEEAMRYLERIKKPDFMFMCLRDVQRVNPAATKCAAFIKWATKNAHLLGAAAKAI